ncbi:MAG TPA: EamA family transporter RarD [Rhizomicrobium sp.]|nr:EamA family transporter RarD [Rhizomicrobium sp.]
MSEDPIDHPHAERHGILYAGSAYLIWAVMPLYWNLLAVVPAVELATHRILWCAICVFTISLARGRLLHLVRIVRDRKLLPTLMLTSVLITCNWTIFIYCVESRQLVAASLGYYITPLISIALGVVLLGERVTPVKILAIALATAAVVWQAVQLGYIPWVAPALAFSFGFYGYFRKLTPVDSLDGLTIETCLLFPVTLALVSYWNFNGTGAFPRAGVYIDTLLVFGGPLTAVPLVLFAAGARRVRMVTLGFLQFLSPTLTLILAVALLGEHFTRLDVITFGCVWGALLIVSLEGRIRRFAAGRAL